MKIYDIKKFINNFANEKYAYEWDNTGLQIGDENKNINKILVALDVTTQTVEEAIKNRCDLILSHHPFMFNPINKIDTSTPKGLLIEKIIKNDISVYSAHTNMDISLKGLNYYMAWKLGLKKIKPLDKTDEEIIDGKALPVGLGAYGSYDSPMKMDEFLSLVKNVYGTNVLKVSENYNQFDTVKEIALCTGGGIDLLNKVKERELKVYITSDGKYHNVQEYYDNGILLIQIGHYDAEICFVDLMSSYLTKEFKDISIIKSKQSNVEEYI